MGQEEFARITADGTQRVLGLRQGVTENATVCMALLEDLQARGDQKGDITNIQQCPRHMHQVDLVGRGRDRVSCPL
jgi:hypothetical protein